MPSKSNRETIRKHNTVPLNDKNKETALFLYGKLDFKRKARIYCTLHKCYLNGDNIKEKKCNYKKCRFRKKIK